MESTSGGANLSSVIESRTTVSTTNLELRGALSDYTNDINSQKEQRSCIDKQSNKKYIENNYTKESIMQETQGLNSSNKEPIDLAKVRFNCLLLFGQKLNKIYK